MEERSNQIIARSMGITLGLLYVGLIGWTLYKYITTKDIESCTLEIIFIVLIPAAIGWFARQDESLTLPRMISGEPVPVEDTTQAKKRRKRHYFWDALGFAIFILISDIVLRFIFDIETVPVFITNNFSEIVNFILTLGVEFIIGFIVFFFIGFVIGEYNIRKYNRHIKELE